MRIPNVLRTKRFLMPSNGRARSHVIGSGIGPRSVAILKPALSHGYTDATLARHRVRRWPIEGAPRKPNKNVLSHRDLLEHRRQSTRLRPGS
jgi:hypothetical protein